MKKLILFLVLLLFLISCRKEIEEPQINYTKIVNELNNKNIEIERLYNLTNINYTNLFEDFNDCKDNNNDLKLELLNKTACYITQDCTTCTRLLNKKEIELEKCWMYNKTCVINKTFIYQNWTLINLYNDCTNKLKKLNDTYNSIMG